MNITELIPELSLINDASLMAATVKVYERALEVGGWVPNDLKRIPFTLLIPTEISYLDHVRAVTKTSLGIAKTIHETYPSKSKINFDVLIAGAILHDIGKLLEYTSENQKIIKSRCGKNLRHPFSGVGVAFGMDVPCEVLHIIAVHAKEGDGGYRSQEAIIVHHADFANFECLKEGL